MGDDAMVVAGNSDWTLDHLKGMVQVIEQTTYTADSAGEIGEMDSCCIGFETFNEQGYAVKYEDKDRDGRLTMEMVMTLTASGKFESATRSEGGVQVWKRKVTYDADGKVLFAVDTDSSGAVTRYSSKISENEFGQVLGGEIHTGDSIFIGVWTRKYIDGIEAGRAWTDSLGVETYNSNGELNKDGLLYTMNIVEIVEDVSTTKIETYVYDNFDETGNWTQRTIYGESQLAIKVEKRVYTYFE